MSNIVSYSSFYEKFDCQQRIAMLKYNVMESVWLPMTESVAEFPGQVAVPGQPLSHAGADLSINNP